MGKDSDKHKKRKKEKHKKEKKHKSKKEKKRKYSSSDSSSSSEEEWVENTPSSSKTLDKPKERDEWMSMEAIFSGKTRKELNENEKKCEKEDEKKSVILNEPGQSSRELNPFWKNGGTGLPSEDAALRNRASSGVGDRGVDWLRRALVRGKEQAKDEGRSLEDVMSERYGSLDEFYTLLKEAESQHQSSHHSGRHYYDSKYSDSKSYSQLKKLNFKKPDSSKSHSDREYQPRESSSSQRKNWKKPGYETNKEQVPSTSSRRSDERKIEFSERSNIPVDKTYTVKEDKPISKEKIPSLDELNYLCADMFRAELKGQHGLYKELQRKVEKARLRRAEAASSTGVIDEKGRNVAILTETDNQGFSRPVKMSSEPTTSKKQKVSTHEDKKRVRYFADDDKYSLQDMFEKEKFNSAKSQNETFLKLMKKHNDDAYDEVDIIDDRNEGKKERESAISKMSVKEKALDNCRWCISSEKASNECIVLCKDKIYLAVPSFQSLTDRHCLIVPQFHVPCATLLDEDVWEEIMDLRKLLVELFEKDDEDIIFFESAFYIDRHPHMLLHCVPVPKEVGDTAPIFFKKAIMECESEWSDNKKVVELAGKNVRKAVPKGLPYFAVDFGLQSGYAHVIEDKKLFPNNFGQEIIGGMLDLDHRSWRKPKRDSAEKIKEKVDLLKKLFDD